MRDPRTLAEEACTLLSDAMRAADGGGDCTQEAYDRMHAAVQLVGLDADADAVGTLLWLIQDLSRMVRSRAPEDAQQRARAAVDAAFA